MEIDYHAELKKYLHELKNGDETSIKELLLLAFQVNYCQKEERVSDERMWVHEAL
jgi:hypothetical protein